LQLKETKTNVSFDKKEIITDRRAIDQKKLKPLTAEPSLLAWACCNAKKLKQPYEFPKDKPGTS